MFAYRLLLFTIILYHFRGMISVLYYEIFVNSCSYSKFSFCILFAKNSAKLRVLIGSFSTNFTSILRCCFIHHLRPFSSIATYHYRLCQRCFSALTKIQSSRFFSLALHWSKLRGSLQSVLPIQLDSFCGLLVAPSNLFSLLSSSLLFATRSL